MLIRFADGSIRLSPSHQDHEQKKFQGESLRSGGPVPGPLILMTLGLTLHNYIVSRGVPRLDGARGLSEVNILY